MPKCIVRSCINQSELTHRITVNKELRLKWLKNVDRLDLLEKTDTAVSHMVVCSNHFPQNLYSFPGSKKLISKACPTLDLAEFSSHKNNDEPELFLGLEEAVNITTMLKSTALPTRNLPTYEGKDIKCKCHLPLPSYASYCCVQECNQNSLRFPENIFHQLPISHELNVCECIGLNNLTSPADFLSKNLKVCDQHFKQNAMLIYINSAKVTITSDFIAKKVNEIKSEDSSCNVIKYTSVLNENSLPQNNILLNALTTQPKIPSTSDKFKTYNTILDPNIKIKNEEDYDMDQICRICLQNGDLKKIDNNSYYEKVTITELVSLCIDISDIREVNFPHKICSECIKNLKSIYNFKKKCEHSTDILQKYIDKQNNIVKQRLDFEHCYNKPTVPKLDLKQIMENAGISTDGTDFNNIEGFITTPEEIMKSDIPPEIVNKIKDTKSIRKRNKKLSKDILETIKEKRNIKIGGKNFVLAKAFTCKTCKDIFFTEESLKNHTCIKKSEYVPSKPFKYKKCMKCKVIIHNQFEQITHTCLKRKRTQLTCRKCGVKFKAYSLLLEHTCDPENVEKYKEKVSKKIGPRVYRCKDCSNKFDSFKELVKHKRLDHHQQNIYQLKIPRCRYCKITFKNMDELQQHRAASHGTSRIVTCPTCLKQMTAISYHTHKDIHLVEKRFCCEYCGNRFTSRTNFQAHVKTVHLKLKPYVCDICNRAYNVRSKLIEHKNMHSDVKKYMCDMCGAPFVYKSSLESHFKKNRCGKTKGLNVVHKCSICEEILPTRAKLKEHRKTYHYTSIKKRSYTCELCKVPFDGQVDLINHELTHGEKPFSCVYCKRSYFTRERLEQHIKIHLTITCRCEVCSKGFANKVLLKQHMSVHTGEKKHLCTYCPKRFSQSAHLSAHIRTHTGYKPFRCPHCDKAFALNGNLTAHIRTHTGYQPYSCLFCDQSFIDVRSRKRHMIRKHYHSIVMEDHSTVNNDAD